jgi:hypothetical protein
MDDLLPNKILYAPAELSLGGLPAQCGHGSTLAARRAGR